MPTEPRPTKPTSTLASSSGRPVQMHMRPDLEIQRQTYQGRDYWVIKDPLTLKYFRFEEEEWALLKMLDGNLSPAEIKERFDYQFAPQKITLPELYQFIGMLHRSSLIVSELPDQGSQLLARGKKNRRNQIKQALSNILSIRFKGIDPDRWLDCLNATFGWIFSLPAFAMVVCLGLGALALIFTNFELFQSKLPTFQEFFAAKNWFWLALVLAATKVLHELGHGLACKRFGAQCHEMGLMLLVFTPCLYVNVSDAWLLPNKWKRIFISAAGMYIELIIAACAVFVWWFSHPGLVHQLALNVIVVCSVSTLLINANPLLRYDGYYILSDLLEIPNLRSKATASLHRAAGEWCLGIEARPDPFLPSRGQILFIAYSLAAAGYRWLITLSIFWFLYRMLEPYGLQIIGQLMAMFVIFGLLIAPLWKLYKYFSVPGRLNTVKPVRLTISACLLAACVAGVCLIPIPHHVYCHVYLQAAQAVNVYVEEEGILEKIHVPTNIEVAAGQVLLSLGNRNLQAQLASLTTQLELAKVEEQNIMNLVTLDENASDRIGVAKAAVTTARECLAKRSEDLQRLEVRAPVQGFLIPPPKKIKKESDNGELATWHDTPLNQKNVGAFLEKQTLVGQIVPDLTKLEAVLVIDQTDVEYIRPDQETELFMESVPGTRYRSRTNAATPSKMDAVPKALSSKHGGAIVVKLDKDGIEVPESTKFLIKVPLANTDQVLRPGNTGLAKIRVGTMTIGSRLWRAMNQTFQFEL